MRYFHNEQLPRFPRKGQGDTLSCCVVCGGDGNYMRTEPNGSRNLVDCCHCGGSGQEPVRDSREKVKEGSD